MAKMTRQISFAAGAMLWTALTLPAASGQTPRPTEYQVKAAYLYNFARFAAWPGKAELRAGHSFNICILGQDSFGAALDAVLAGETIDHKQTVAKRIVRPQDAAECRVLFVGSSEESRWNEMLPALERLSILTVSDIPRFTQRGGMIQFHVVANKVRFEVNLSAAERVGLGLSSELLKLALRVNRTP
jgi:hypothetical protein